MWIVISYSFTVKDLNYPLQCSMIGVDADHAAAAAVGVFKFISSAKEEVNAFARICLSVCLSVCLLARLLKNVFGWNVSCQQMSVHGRTD